MENQIFELQYAMDTFYFLVCGALVMWMAAGFAMLEAGLVRKKNAASRKPYQREPVRMLSGTRESSFLTPQPI